jgi:hypothetical protein
LKAVNEQHQLVPFSKVLIAIHRKNIPVMETKASKKKSKISRAKYKPLRAIKKA